MSSHLFKVQGGAVDLEPVVSAWLPDKKQLLQATRTATRKTLRWARALAVREVRAATGLPAAILRDRILVRMKTHNGRSRLFFGLHPIPAAKLAPRQGKAGVNTKGGGHIPGAFLVDLGSHDAVFKREGKERYPLEYQRVYFHKQAERVIKGHILPEWEAVYLKNLEQELKWRTR